MRATAVDYGLLGSLQLVADGEHLQLGAPKQRAVLAVLLVNRNRPVSTDSIISAVWDDSPVPAARASIQSHVSNLRRLMRTAGLEPNRVLASAPPGYQLNVADTDCDVGRFSSAKAAGVQAAAAGRFEEASRQLSAALAEWRGPVLHDLNEFPFVGAVAARLSQDKVAAQIALTEAEIACGRAEAVISELEALTSEHLYREPLWAQLISAYYLTERQSDALAAFRRLKTVLAEDLGIDPGPTITALHEQILRQEPLRIAGRDVTTRKRNVRRIEPAAPELPAPRPPLARLRDKAGRQYRLNGVTTRIGRSTDNDIVLDDTDVSRNHAVVADNGGAFVLTDLRSTNGVEVQGRLIRGSVTLADGDRIRIGGKEFTVEIRQS